MATPNIQGVYELLLRAMQQQQGAGACRMPNSGPGYNSDGNDSPQGGLLGRLLALQARQNPYQPPAEDSRAAPAVPPDPNFRQLSRVPSANRTEGAIGPPNRYEDQSSTSYGQPIFSDPNADPVKPGSQYLGGATILNSRKKPSSGDDEEDDRELDVDEMKRRFDEGVKARARARDKAGREAAARNFDPGDFCTSRHLAEERECRERWDEVAHTHYRRACENTAFSRYAMCRANGGQPDPNEPPKWDPDRSEETYHRDWLPWNLLKK